MLDNVQDLEDIRTITHARNIAVDVVTYDCDVAMERKIVLNQREGHYDLAVGIPGDDVVGPYPLHHTREHCLPANFPARYPTQGTYRSWKQLFFGRGAEPSGAREWMSWQTMWADLAREFGDNGIARDVVIDGVETDERLCQLAGWADYHRTSVIVNWKNQ